MPISHGKTSDGRPYVEIGGSRSFGYDHDRCGRSTYNCNDRNGNKTSYAIMCTSDGCAINGGPLQEMPESHRKGYMYISQMYDICSQDDFINATTIFDNMDKNTDPIVILGLYGIIKVTQQDPRFRTECMYEYLTHKCNRVEQSHNCFSNFNPRDPLNSFFGVNK